jgi:hypothetical protein
VRKVSSTIHGNMSTVSAQVVYTLSTRQGGMRRVRSPTNAHGGSRGKWSEGLHPKASEAAEGC